MPKMESPFAGKTLQVYLAVTDESISSVLAVERNKKHSLIHFVSMALQGPETNYLDLGKTSTGANLYGQTVTVLLSGTQN